MIRRLLLAFGLIITAQFTLAQNGSAQTSNPSSNISIRPFLQQLTLSSEEPSKQFELNIINNSKSAQSFSLSAVNFGSLDETGGVVFEGANSIKINSYGLANWIVLDKDAVDLEPAQQTKVNVTITNGNDLTPGAHYAAIIVSGIAGTSGSANLSLKPQVSSLLFLTKLGGERYNIHLASISQNSTLWAPPNKVNLKLSSTGNTFIIPRGIVSLKQNGHVKSKGIINEQSSIVLPQGTRSFDVNLNKISSLSSGLLYKKYQIQIDYRYDGINKYATKTIALTIVNKLSVFIILVMILAMLVYKRLLHDNQNLREYIKKRRNKGTVRK